MKGYIYFIINNINGKRYVGQTVDINSIDRVSSVKKRLSYQDYIHIYERKNNK